MLLPQHLAMVLCCCLAAAYRQQGLHPLQHGHPLGAVGGAAVLWDGAAVLHLQQEKGQNNSRGGGYCWITIPSTALEQISRSMLAVSC
jgi:hypothetical protein